MPHLLPVLGQKKNRAGGMPARICLREIEAGIWIFRSSADSLSLDSCHVFKSRMVPAAKNSFTAHRHRRAAFESSGAAHGFLGQKKNRAGGDVACPVRSFLA